jgi:hypothetical protein
MARGQSSEVEARGALEAWRRSGLSIERFAKQRGIVPQRLRWWKLKISASEKAIAVSATPALMPVRVTADAPRSRGESVTVLLRTGHMLKVSHGFDETAFTRSSRHCSARGAVRQTDDSSRKTRQVDAATAHSSSFDMKASLPALVPDALAAAFLARGAWTRRALIARGAAALDTTARAATTHASLHAARGAKLTATFERITWPPETCPPSSEPR